MPLNALLGIDGRREAALAIVTVGEGADVPSAPGSLPDLALATEPLSTREVRYTEIEAAHQASSLATVPEVIAWRQAGGRVSQAVPPDISDGPDSEDVIRRRRSTRRFEGRPIIVLSWSASSGPPRRQSPATCSSPFPWNRS